MWPSSLLTCAWLNTHLSSTATVCNAHQTCSMFPPHDMKDLHKTYALLHTCGFTLGSGTGWLCNVSQLSSTAAHTVLTNCSLNVLKSLVWYSKCMVNPEVLLELNQSYYLLPKGVFMPLLNCGSPSAGFLLHWYWATTNYQLITSGKNWVKCASLSLFSGNHKRTHRFMKQDTVGSHARGGCMMAPQSSLMLSK